MAAALNAAISVPLKDGFLHGRRHLSAPYWLALYRIPNTLVERFPNNIQNISALTISPYPRALTFFSYFFCQGFQALSGFSFRQDDFFVIWKIIHCIPPGT